jgi:transcriptional regulator GlxA family with amidase domain
MVLAEVAAASGFAENAHLGRPFVRSYGVRPRALAAALRRATDR